MIMIERFISIIYVCMCVGDIWNKLAYIQEMNWSHVMESNPHNDKIIHH